MRAQARIDRRQARIRSISTAATATLLAAALVAGGSPAVAASTAASAASESSAPGAPGAQATWTTGAKQGVGTATTAESKVWYTLSEGTLAEVYYPRVDVANSRSLELIVTDGSTFADLESTDTTHEVKLPDPRSLVYTQVNTDRDGRYQVIKTCVTDPARSTVVVNIVLRSLDGGRYTVYAAYDPALANSGMHDSARTVDAAEGGTRGGALVAHDTTGDEPIASALIANRPFRATSNGFVGASDGLADLAADFDLDDTFAQATDGNVAQIAQLDLRGFGPISTATLALGFGASEQEAIDTAKATMSTGAIRVGIDYARGWHAYLRSLDAVPASVSGDAQLATQYRVAAMTLKAHEDKTFRGANIASLTVPWGEAQNANEAGVGGYHLVWARDLHQVATAQLAAGDADAANRSLDYLFDVQQKTDGSFPQNTLLDGTPYWTSLQLDEVAFPIVLAWQLGRTDASTYTDHVKKAADFIVRTGPSTPQERWEEEGGYSPSTIAAEIAGLTAAADIARVNGDEASAALYTGVADEWQRSVESWTYTTTGPLGDGSYYTRIDANGDPNDGGLLDINNGGGAWDEREIVDGGFLDLVRLGVKPADDAVVASSLPEVDSTLRVDTPNGELFYRYNHDGYGEKADGAPYDGTGVGRLWPLLSGERGEYELANGRDASSYLRTMANSANDGYMIPEQVWDTADAPAYGLELGDGTGSATPLAWSMAQYLRLAQSIDAGTPVETPSVVADRYATGTLVAGPSLEVTSPIAGTTAGASATVAGLTTAASVWVNAAGQTVRADVADGAFSIEIPLTLGANGITVVAVGADGGTSTVQRVVSSTNFGETVGVVADPSGDDNGPGSYVYPTNSAFNPGAFDLTEVGIYDDGTSYNFVATIAGKIQNPWGGNQIAVQRLDFYLAPSMITGDPTVSALPGTHAELIGPYGWVISASGFMTPTVRFSNGDIVSTGSLLALPETRQIVVSVPKAPFGSLNMSFVGIQAVMMSHADAGEGEGNIRPVYDRDYWDAAAGTDQAFVQEYRFGGGAGEWTDVGAAKDTDTSDPNALDVLVPSGATQGEVLDWRSGPVVLPYVTLAG